ncbi:MAG: metallopeptidase TldD-related protein [Myxococcota bacterium]
MVFADADERHCTEDVAVGLVVSGFDGATWHELATDDLSASGVAAALDAMRSRAGVDSSASPAATAVAPGRDFAIAPVADPRTLAPADKLSRVSELYQSSRRVGGSRIVYRGAYAVVSDRDLLYIAHSDGNSRDLYQRLLWTRAGVLMIAQRMATVGFGDAAGGDDNDDNSGDDEAAPATGPASLPMPVLETAERAAAAGLETIEIPLAALDRAAQRALSLVTPTPAPAGETEVLLEPAVTAWIVARCVAPAVRGEHWLSGLSGAAAMRDQPVAAPFVELSDDPGATNGYGSYFFDDAGELAGPAALIRAGRLLGPIAERHTATALGVPLTAHGRRTEQFGPLRALPSYLTLSTSDPTAAAPYEQLVASMKRGLLLEGAIAAHIDLRSWRFSVRVARAHQIVAGKRTGVLYGAVLIRGAVPDLLRAASAVSSEPAPTFAFDQPIAHSVSAPYLLTRAEVAPI